VADPPVFVHSEAPVAEAAARLVDALRDAERERAHAAVRLAIPGGSALAPLGAARSALADTWQRIRLCWVDERCVPLGDRDSNRGAAYRSGALDAAQPPALELPLWLDAETPGGAIRRVETALADDFADALDVLLLGLGEDGHVASLFPHVRPDPRANAAFVPDAPKPPPRRITLTLRMLCSARRAVLLATGAGKRAALERLAGRDPTLPATALRGLVVVSDQRIGDRTARDEEEAG
jgi:6-phosphogluconolactonase